MNRKAFLSEVIGTFALVFIGAGSAALATGILTVAFAHGLVVTAFIYALGQYSGIHINPAVTFGMWVAKAIDIKEAAYYWVAQILGGVLAGFGLSVLLSEMGTNLGMTTLAGGISPLQGFLIETILTFFLVTVILHTAVKGNQMAGLAIGLTLAFCIMMGGPLTGASLNPARTLGPALFMGEFANIGIYILGPLLGGGLAALLYTKVFKKK